MDDSKPAKRRRARSDKGTTRSGKPKPWRGTVYLSRTEYPAKTIVEKIEAHMQEFPGDNLSKLFEREMANILQLPLTPELTLADLIERMMILTEEYELKIEAMDQRLDRFDKILARLESGSLSFSQQPTQASAPVDVRAAERSEEGAAYLGNMFGGMKSRQRRDQ